MLKDKIRKHIPSRLGSEVQMTEVVSDAGVETDLFSSLIHTHGREMRRRQFDMYRKFKKGMSGSETFLRNQRCDKMAKKISETYVDRTTNIGLIGAGLPSKQELQVYCIGHLTQMTGVSDIHIIHDDDMGASEKEDGIKFFIDSIEYDKNNETPVDFEIKNGFFRLVNPENQLITMVLPTKFIVKNAERIKNSLNTAEMNEVATNIKYNYIVGKLTELISNQIFYGFITALYKERYREMMTRDNLLMMGILKEYKDLINPVPFNEDEEKWKKLRSNINEASINSATFLKSERFGYGRFYDNIIGKKTYIPMNINVYDFMEVTNIRDYEVVTFMVKLFGGDNFSLFETVVPRTEYLAKLSVKNEMAGMILMNRVLTSAFASFYHLGQGRKAMTLHKLTQNISSKLLKSVNSNLSRDLNHTACRKMHKKVIGLCELENKINDPALNLYFFYDSIYRTG